MLKTSWYFFKIFSESKNSSSQSRHPTIVTLAKNYRIHYVKMIKEINGITTNQSEKRSLESPTMITSKRQRPSSASSTSSNSNNILQTLRNRIRNEENERFYLNDERRM
jgi:hypothetical protein